MRSLCGGSLISLPPRPPTATTAPPGDFWTDGPLLEHLRGRVERVQWDPATRQYLQPYAGMTKVGQARTRPTRTAVLPH